MFSKKKTECRVCGYRFTPERENIYTAEEPRSMTDMLTKAPTRFSAVDCPVCGDRKSTRLNSSHCPNSYAGFCLKKKKKKRNEYN